ncbi:hypothetical protein ACFQRD_08780 [Brachybacterium sp. GCM10030268]|uniref:hypothetical protein n=1 Tax=Brachybacterium sp. GCM10030268 TaxID=3273382 RepID=UPI00361447E8
MSGEAGFRAARRHAGELGRPLEVYADRPGTVVVGAIVFVWLIFTGLTLINPAESPLLIAAPGIIFALLAAGILVLISGERLIVCERGLLVGSVAPGMRPYIVRYEQIVPGSLVPVTGAGRYGRETGTGGFPQSTVRRSAWNRQGIHFVGPSAQAARRRPALIAVLQDPPPRSVDGRWVWFAGTGRTSPETLTARIAQAAGASGAQQLARATASAPARKLSGDPAEAAAHLPGLR